MRTSTLIVAFLIFGSTVASAQTLQERYNAAEIAFQQGKYSAAVDGYEHVLGRMSARQKEGRSGAELRLRIAEAFYNLSRFSETISHIEAALLVLTPLNDVPELKAPIAEAMFRLGTAYEALGEMKSAGPILDRAIAQSAGTKLHSEAKFARARVSIFTDPSIARRLFGELLAETPKSDDKSLALLKSMRARVELNRGDFATAKAMADEAISDAGGLGRRVTIIDTQIRGDGAIAAFFLGREADAFNLLAKTGAARVGDEAPAFPHHSTIALPECAPLGTVRPDDVMVVEVTIRDDGTVAYVRPIYSSRPSEIEAAFVGQILKWQWTSEDLATVDPFWRQSMRLEVRCTVSETPLWFGRQLAQELEAAMQSPPVEVMQVRAGLQRTIAAQRLFEKLDAGGAPPSQLLPLGYMLVQEGPGDDRTAARFADRVRSLAALAGLSARHRNILDVVILRNSPNDAASDSGLPTVDQNWDADVRAMLMAEQGRRAELKRRNAEAQRRYEAVLALGLSPGNPAAQFAALRLASLAFARRDETTASALLKQSGLSPQQCSLFDLAPVMTRKAFLPEIYPQIAMNLGFDGNILMTADVSRDGVPIEPRVVLAYPPFVFNAAVTDAMKRSRFKPIYREGTQIGCSGFRQVVRFKLGGN